jgi:hypothetical protein
MGVALHGNLKDFGLAEVFQLIGQQRKTGVLEISGQGAKARLAFAEGSVLWARPVGASEHAGLGDMLVRCGLLTREALEEALRESEDTAQALPSLLVSKGTVSAEDVQATAELLSHDTIFEVLRWTRGSFHFSASNVGPRQPTDELLAAEQILMDGLRMVDEWNTFAQLVPSLDTVFRRAGSFEVYRQRAQGDLRRRMEQAERVWNLVDGRLPARRIIDLSRIGTFEATRVLAELRQAGLIEVVDAQQARAARRRQRSLRPVARQVGFWLAAAFPLVLLAAAVSLTFPSLPSSSLLPLARRESSASYPLARHPFEAARQAFEQRRLRHAIEAYRFQTGSWPESLSALEGHGGLADGALTHSSSAPYYYSARRGEGALLLAPER